MKVSIVIYSLSLLVLMACETKSKETNKQINNITQGEISEGLGNVRSTSWIGAKEIVANADNVNYKVDESFQGKAYDDIVYLSAYSNGNIAGLSKDGSVVTFDSKGKELNRFKPSVEGKVTSITTDEQNQLWVFSNDEKKETHKVRGRMVERVISLGVVCSAYDVKGKQLSQMKLDTLKSAFAARFKDDKLIVSDAQTKSVAVFNRETGKSESIITGMRQCGGVLDINISPNNELLIANLGSFRVELFDIAGKRLGDFGQRGKEIENFHGCCNPVSLTNLTNGAVVTVEKTPSRIKIYSKAGVQELPLAEELKDCKYMPFTSDKDNNLYVGAAEKGIVKYSIRN